MGQEQAAKRMIEARSSQEKAKDEGGLDEPVLHPSGLNQLALADFRHRGDVTAARRRGQRIAGQTDV